GAALLASVTSSWSVGLAWIVPNYMFRFTRRVDHSLILIITMLLLFVAIVPHPTAVVAEYLQHPAEQQTALMLFSATWLMIAASINLLWWYATSHGLVDPKLDPRLKRGMMRRYLAGLALYLIAFVAAYFSFFV